jgi:hypothetical protein
VGPWGRWSQRCGDVILFRFRVRCELQAAIMLGNGLIAAEVGQKKKKKDEAGLADCGLNASGPEGILLVSTGSQSIFLELTKKLRSSILRSL